VHAAHLRRRRFRTSVRPVARQFLEGRAPEHHPIDVLEEGVEVLLELLVHEVPVDVAAGIVDVAVQ
jgi:hypothetical protein